MFRELGTSFVSKVRIGNGEFIEAKGKGKTVICTESGNKTILEVLFVPDIDQNLLSVGQLLEKGYFLIFEGKTCVIKDSFGQELVTIDMHDRSFTLDVNQLEANAHIALADESYETLYRQVVGSLQYLCLTRLDLSFVINKVSQYMHQPHDVHWTTVKRILRYVRGTIDYGLLLQESSMSLTRFCDADWASSLEDRKSTFGFCLYLGDNLVGWMSKKQSVVSQFNSEAGYWSLANATSELAWFRSLLDEIGVKLSGTPIFGVIMLALFPWLQIQYYMLRLSMLN
ncbi:uncharacterized mitochondrial protein AtMg00810-like [Gossypium hirsutum]|uniref:Uncharacterized mitochondrial protein AtMg00810-like n=1 Tax=Gossypium hirsutum TaxID=3635 RepID=A0ABM2ZJ52_GOSHI|nr:uncharacterized mitochondrial protein AtMg00810-like [Gossypium hirsutum]